MSRVPGITNKDVRRVVDAALARGWTYEWTGSTHLKLTHPNGGVVHCSCTTRSWSAAHHVARDIGRIERLGDTPCTA